MAGETLPSGSTNTQGLANWAAPYITNYLGQAQALSETPYQTYGGPLTAGASNLQNQAFSGIAGLTVPTGINQAATTAGNLATQAGNTQYGAVGSDFGATQAQQYMNPYLKSALNPAMDEARRQADIGRMADAGRLTQAGAFGGSRQAIMESEGRRNLMDKQNQMLTSGYSTAFDKAQQQFNADQARKIQEQQFGSELGLKGLQAGIQGAQTQGQLSDMQNKATLANLQQQLTGGGIERGITSEGVAADKEEFEKQRQFPYQQVQFQRDMISGLPAGSVTNTPGQLSGVGSLLQALGGGTAAAQAFGYKDVTELLKGLGLTTGS